MKLTPPKTITWWISLILLVLGLLGYFSIIGVLSPFAFFFVVAGLILLLLACLIKGL